MGERIISDRLFEKLQNASSDDKVKVVVIAKSPKNSNYSESTSRIERRQEMFTAHEEALQPLRKHLDSLKANRRISDYTSQVTTLTACTEMTPLDVYAMARMHFVDNIIEDQKIRAIKFQ